MPEPPIEPPTRTSTGASSPSRRATGKPPSIARQAWNLAQSLADFIADGCTTLTEEQYRRRLEICNACRHRQNNRCTKCGCRLAIKARGRAFACPEAKWPAN